MPACWLTSRPRPGCAPSSRPVGTATGRSGGPGGAGRRGEPGGRRPGRGRRGAAGRRASPHPSCCSASPRPRHARGGGRLADPDPRTRRRADGRWWTAVGSSLAGPPFPVHVKVDTGMHRVGAARRRRWRWRWRRPRSRIWRSRVSGPTWPSPTRSTTPIRPAAAVLRGRAGRPGPGRRAAHHAPRGQLGGGHVAPASRYDLVRCGVALYGLAPHGRVARRPCPDSTGPVASRPGCRSCGGRRPASGSSYGLRYRLPARLGRWRRCRSATPTARPAALFDNGRLGLSSAATPSHRGLRHHGPDSRRLRLRCRCATGDVAVLLGARGREITGVGVGRARTDTIAYEVVCGMSAGRLKKKRGVCACYDVC